MWFLRGLQCDFSVRHLCQSVLIVFICLQLSSNTVDARHDELLRQHHRLRRVRSMADESSATKSCDLVKHFFDALNVTINPQPIESSTGKFDFFFLLVSFEIRSILYCFFVLTCRS